jgi:DNA-binding transcriptional MerR regulator
MRMLIGELAERAGVSARALRHYEDRELLVPDRDVNGYRL